MKYKIQFNNNALLNNNIIKMTSQYNEKFIVNVILKVGDLTNREAWIFNVNFCMSAFYFPCWHHLYVRRSYLTEHKTNMRLIIQMLDCISSLLLHYSTNTTTKIKTSTIILKHALEHATTVNSFSCNIRNNDNSF